MDVPPGFVFMPDDRHETFTVEAPEPVHRHCFPTFSLCPLRRIGGDLLHGQRMACDHGHERVLVLPHATFLAALRHCPGISSGGIVHGLDPIDVHTINDDGRARRLDVKTGSKVPARLFEDEGRVAALDRRNSYRGEGVVQSLERVCRKVGYPKTTRVEWGLR